MTYSIAKTALKSPLGSAEPAAGVRESVEKMMKAKSIQELAIHSQQGDEGAFAELYRRLYPRLQSFLQKRLALSADVEEVLQDAFLKAWRNIERFDSKFQFSTWLYTIAIRTAKDRHRKGLKHLETMAKLCADEASVASSTVEAIAERCEQSENIWSTAKQVLTQDQYSAMWLRYGEELSIKDVAEVMRKTSVGVRVLLHRARTVLQNVLKDEC